MKLKLLQKFNYAWDVLFTVINIGHLHMWIKLKEKERDLIHDKWEEKQEKHPKLDLEEYDNWEEVQ